jgi:hypothetical protein
VLPIFPGTDVLLFLIDKRNSTSLGITMLSHSRLSHIAPKIFVAFCLLFMVMAYRMADAKLEGLPRNEKLPLFDPHILSYVCAPVPLPRFDAQADAWFQEARALEDPEIYVDDRDYGKIVALTRQAADRKHWKAMINLASFIIEGRDPPSSADEAVQLVEAAMKMGVPAAYDRMGTFYMNGTGVKPNATRAYAFWQQAAKMGNPESLTDLGRKMFSLDDRPSHSRWANAAVGINMLECAYGQGHGPAAYELGFLYSSPIGHAATKEELQRALTTWHNGVKFGSAKCAAAISGEFRSTERDRLAMHVDIARSERYRLLARILEFYPDYRFPNLDKIIPLPPNDLPTWNGDRDTLLNAARGVSYPPFSPSSPSVFSERKGRFFLDPLYRLVPTDDITDEDAAPFTGYWQPVINEDHSQQEGVPKTPPPALYQVGERFERVETVRRIQARDGAPKLRWRNWRTVRHDQGTISPPVVTKRTRSVTPPAKTTACADSEHCAATGTWQPWIHAEHIAQDAVNQYWRQAWLLEGQRFPDPKVDWMLDVADADITWYLMDSAGVDLCPA